MSQSGRYGRFLYTLDGHRPHSEPYPEWLNAVLDARLRAPISGLALTKFQRSVVESLKLNTVGELLAAEESVFIKVKGVK